MGSTFKPHILVEKLVKLNSSQQSIETLSHWCIFHMNKAKKVVETWDRQFHCSPREQRLAFLYLANDILQNSRRKGSEFVSEFWKVLPDALRVVLENGDKSERNAALRLINIWEERKVFGSQGQLLKEELVGKNLNTSKVSGNPPGFNLTNSAGNAVDKIASAYQVLYGGQLDEETILHKCMDAIRYIEKVDKEIGGGISSEQLIRAGTMEEIKGQQAILMGCIEQLIDVQSCRTNLVSYLTEALHEQEVKLSHLRHQLQDAQSQSEQAENLCRQIMNTVHSPTEKKESHNASEASQSLMDEKEVQTAPVMYTTQVPYNEKLYHIEENSKSAVAASAAPVTASTSSAQVLPHVLPSFTSDGVIVNTVKGTSDDYSPEKKLKLESGHSVYLQSQIPQPPVPPYPHPDSLQHHVAITSTELASQDQPPLPSSPPPMPPLPPSNPFLVPGQFMPSAGSIASGPYSYGLIQQQAPPFPFPAVGSEYNGSSNFPPPPAISYQNYQNAGRFYGQQSFPATPVSRQL